MKATGEGENLYSLKPGETVEEMKERDRFVCEQSKEALKVILKKDKDFNPYEEIRARKAQAGKRPAKGTQRPNPPPLPTKPTMKPSFPAKKDSGKCSYNKPSL